MRFPLTGGSYEARSLIASAQRCINLIPEALPQGTDEPAPMAHYPTPGLKPFAVAPSGGPWRGLWWAGNGTLFGMCGNKLYRIGSDATLTESGAINTSSGMVGMSDNGVELALVDGTNAGYSFDFGSGIFSAISDPAFYGADRVDFMDTFFVFNRPDTNQWYLSDSLALTFDALYVGSTPDAAKVVSLAVITRQLWLLGVKQASIWQDVGAPDFPFQEAGGTVEHGCAAKHSVTKADGSVFWLSRSNAGQAVMLMTEGYQAKRISNHALEAHWQGFASVSDAVSWSYQAGGHTVLVVVFPTAGETWCYDLATGFWHEWQTDGGRHRGICAVTCGTAGDGAHNGRTYVGDYANGNLYVLDPATFSDNGGAPIVRTRRFPHLLDDGHRVFYTSLIADMQTGTAPAGVSEAVLTLRYSDDRGATWSLPLTTGLGAFGKALTSLQFQRLGMARDRIFELSWAAPYDTALQGAWIQTRRSAS